MTVALYRRYRPDTFADVIGQEHVTEPLMTALRADRVTHAYLFSGPRGCGKTSSARILARCLNCAEGPTDNPCGTCDSCVELARGGSGSLDVVEIDAASHNGVDDARDLRERAAFAPARDRFKIFILDEAHMVTTQGFNALLKLVEEPPPHVKFVFATTEPDRVIGTIRSRTHHYPFRLVPPQVLQRYLSQLCESEGVDVASGVLPLVVRAGGGSVRDTLSVLDQLIAGARDGVVDYSRAIGLLGFTHAALLDDAVDALAAHDGASVFRVVDRVIESGHDPRRFVEDLLERLRDLIVILAAGSDAGAVLRAVPEDQLERMRSQAQHLGPSQLSRAADLVNAALSEMAGATSPRLQLELLCARLMLPAADDALLGYGARLDRLERSAADAGGGSEGSGARGAADGVPSWPAMPEAGPGAPESPASSRSTTSTAHRLPRVGEGVPGSAASRAEASVREEPAAAASAGAESTRSEPARAGAPTEPETPNAPARQSGPSDARVRPSDDATSGRGPADRPPSSPSPPQAPESREEPDAGEATPAGSTTTANAATPDATDTDSPVAPDTDPPDETVAGASATPDASMVRRRWPEVLETLAGLRRATWTLVAQNAQVGDVSAQSLTLSFTTDGLARAFASGAHAEQVQRALHETLGLRLEVRPAVDGSGPSDSTPPAGPSHASGTLDASELAGGRTDVGRRGPSQAGATHVGEGSPPSPVTQPRPLPGQSASDREGQHRPGRDRKDPPERTRADDASPDRVRVTAADRVHDAPSPRMKGTASPNERSAHPQSPSRERPAPRERAVVSEHVARAAADWGFEPPPSDHDVPPWEDQPPEDGDARTPEDAPARRTTPPAPTRATAPGSTPERPSHESTSRRPTAAPGRAAGRSHESATQAQGHPARDPEVSGQAARGQETRGHAPSESGSPRTRGLAHAATPVDATPPESDDYDASPDDPDVEHSDLVGAPLVARMLGGTVIDESPDPPFGRTGP